MKHAILTTLAAAASMVTASAVHAQDVKGDAKAGEKKIAMCVGCHGIVGYQASFPEVHKVPKISGQGAGYITAALNEYKKGTRKHPTMRGIATSLTDQDIADVATYYEASGKPSDPLPDTPPAPPADVAALLAKGACAACHGSNFSKPVDPSYPKLAGQYPDYLYVALKAYFTEGNPQVGRNHAIMSMQAKQFNHVAMKAMADYIGSLPGELKTVKESPFVAGSR